MNGDIKDAWDRPALVVEVVLARLWGENYTLTGVGMSTVVWQGFEIE